MSQPKYKLTYFNSKGRAEVIRMLFKAADVPFEDVRIEKENWPALKPNTPLGQLPMLEVDGHSIGQSQAITRYVAKITNQDGDTPIEKADVDSYNEELCDLLPPMIAAFFMEDEDVKAKLKERASNKLPEILVKFENRLKDREFIVGTKMTFVDLHLMTLVTSGWLNAFVSDFDTKYPHIVTHSSRISEMPRIKEWISVRPVTER